MAGEDESAWKLKCEPGHTSEDIKYNPEAACDIKCTPEPIATNVTNAIIISESEAVKRDSEPIHEIIKCPPKCIPDSPSQVIRDDGTDPTSESFKSVPESTCNIKYGAEQICVPGSAPKVKCEPGPTSEEIKCHPELASEVPKYVPAPIGTTLSNATILLESFRVPAHEIIKSSVPSQVIGDDGTDPTSEPFKSAPESTCNASYSTTNIFDSVAKGEK